MKKQKLNYRFHNPNTVEVTAKYITKAFIEANTPKVEQAIQHYANNQIRQENHPAIAG